jgi:hypothetical protein
MRQGERRDAAGCDCSAYEQCRRLLHLMAVAIDEALAEVSRQIWRQIDCS